MRRTAVLLALVLGLGGAVPAAAQGFGLSRGDTSQLQIFADQGIEWQSEAKRVIASGNAKAVRGTSTIHADSLTAYYREGANGEEIWRVDADGNVRIVTPTETATGTKASYDLDKAIFVLRGSPHLTTARESVSARDTLEYWEAERMAVARGEAVATQRDKKIRADVLTAHFKEGANKNLEMTRADAYGNVELTTPKEVVTGDRGDYNVETGIATLTGSVKIRREGNELDGGFAHVNLKTGISKLFAAAPGSRQAGQRVQGVFHPEKDASGNRAASPGGAAAPSAGNR